MVVGADSQKNIIFWGNQSFAPFFGTFMEVPKIPIFGTYKYFYWARFLGFGACVSKKLIFFGCVWTKPSQSLDPFPGHSGVYHRSVFLEHKKCFLDLKWDDYISTFVEISSFLARLCFLYQKCVLA